MTASRDAHYDARRAFVTGRTVMLKRGPFHVRTVRCLTRRGARRLARRWQE